MQLTQSFEKNGNILFRYRGQIPVILFILAVPVIYFTDSSSLSPACVLILNIIAIAASLKGLIIRAITIGKTPKGTSGRNTQEQVAETLNTTGIYSLLRHPLYLGNYLMWTGIVIFTYNIYFFISVTLAFWLYYERIMYAEERFLEKKFGQTFTDWSARVPAFIPSFRNYIKNSSAFSLKNVLSREYSGFSATILGFAFVDVVRYYFVNGTFEWRHASVYAFFVSLVIVLILRTLKHYTKLFNQ